MRLRHTVSLLIGLLALSGRAWAGPVGANPASLTFPDTGVGAVSAGQMVTFTNNGNAQVTVSGVVVAGANPNDFTLDFGIFQPPFAIGPGVNFTVTVKFAPQLGGTRTGTLTAQLAGGVGDTTVPLTGKAIGQKLTVTPSPINAGGSKLNVTTSTMVTIQNAGGGNVKVNGITLGGANANEFTISGAPAYPATLGPGGAGKFTITLNFTPTFQGNNHVAQLNVANDDPNLGPTLVTQITGYGGDPKIATDVGTAAFGNLRVGLTSSPQVINVQNTGNSGLKVSMIVLDAGPGGGGNPADFVLSRGMIPDNTVIPAMGQLPISVSFKPGKVGQTSARVVILSDDPNTPAKYVSLLGNGTEAKPAASPANIDFASQSIYLASMPTSVSFTNAGSDTYSITAITFSGANKDWFRVNGIVVFPVKVAPNATVKIDLIALPLGLGTGTGTATFMTDDAMTPKFDIPLKVNGIGASVQMDPPYGDFGTIGVLAKSTKTFTMKNVGTDVLKMEDFRFVDPMQCSCFQVNNMPVQDMDGNWPSLKPGEMLTFSVLFSPQVEGNFNAQIEIDTSDPMARHVHIPLDGIGAQAGLKVDPVSLNFNTIIVGNQSVPQNITITNTGGATLTINSVTLSGANANNFKYDDPGKFDLAGGQAKVIPVYYQPGAAGMHSASLVITPAGFPAAQVKLSGVAVQPILQVSTGQTPSNVLDFDQLGLVLLKGSTSEPQAVGIKVPSNGIALSIESITVAGSPDFTVDQVSKADLSPGASATFNVFFTPSDTKTKSATITIKGRGIPQALATVMVKGTGIESVVVKRDTSGCSVGAGRNLSGTFFLLLALPGLALIARRRRNSAR